MTIVQQMPVGYAPPAAATREESTLLYNISWETYEQILAGQGERPIRLTYDRGLLEIITISTEHGRYSYLLGYIVMILAEEMNVRIQGADPATFKRQALERGLEPDKWFYIASAGLVAGMREIDLERDPPPNLVLEIDLASSSLNRMGTYAALRVPEVWRFDGQVLQANLLQGSGGYLLFDKSPLFPGIPLSEMVPFLHQGLKTDDLALGRAFRTWVREQVSMRQSGK